MNPRTTGILLLIAAALGAFVYLYEVRGSEERRDAEQAAKRLFAGVATTDVAWIELKTTDGRVARAERQDGAWRIVSPIAFPGDGVNLDGIAAGLVDLVSETQIESPQAPEVYGIDAASRVVRFGAAGAEHELRIGKKVPVGSSTYVAAGAQPGRIVTIPTYRASNLDRSLDDLRDRRVLNFDRSSIHGVDVRWPGGHIVAERGDGGWRLIEPLAGRADDATLDALLSNLSYLRADSFEDAPPPDAESGLDEPAFAAMLRTRPAQDGAAPTEFRVAFGAERGGKRLVRGTQPSLYRVAAQRLDDLPRSVMAYRFKQVSSFTATDAKSVEITLRGETGAPFEVKLVHGEGGWKGEPEAIEPGKAARLVAELAHLRAAEIVDEEATEDDLARFGLVPPRASLRVLGSPEGVVAPPVLARIDVGSGAGEAGPVVRDPSSRVVYRLEPSAQDWLPLDRDGFRRIFAPAPAGAGAEGSGTDMLPEGAEPIDDEAVSDE